MSVSIFSSKRLLIIANEAGSSSLLAEFTNLWQPDTGSAVVCSQVGARYFGAINFPVYPDCEFPGVEDAVEFIKKINPDWVILGTSVGFSVEKLFILAARISRARTAAFVDHYWNLWQRFAHEVSAEKWFYRTDFIFVSSHKCFAEMVSFGLEESRLHVFSNPLLERAASCVPGRSRRRILTDLGLKTDQRAVLFVSEWLYPADPLWDWEQAAPGDLEYFLSSVLRGVELVNKVSTIDVSVIIKLHPSQSELPHDIFRDFDPSSYRVVAEFSKTELFSVSDVAFGLDSMLLLEAARAGIASYSFHKSGEGRGRWLSDLRREIVELGSATDVQTVLHSVFVGEPLSNNEVSHLTDG